MSVHVKNCAAETPARDQSLVAGGLKESHVAIGKLRRVGRGNLAVHRHVAVARTPTVAEIRNGRFADCTTALLLLPFVPSLISISRIGDPNARFI